MGPPMDHHRYIARRVALASQRMMGAQYPYYLLADTLEGREKEKEITGQPLPPAGVIR